MNITPITMSALHNKNATNCKGKAQAEDKEIYYDTDLPEDRYDVATCGPNYCYYVPKRPTRPSIESQQGRIEIKDNQRETPEEYKQRKLYSSEWTM